MIKRNNAPQSPPSARKRQRRSSTVFCYYAAAVGLTTVLTWSFSRWVFQNQTEHCNTVDAAAAAAAAINADNKAVLPTSLLNTAAGHPLSRVWGTPKGWDKAKCKNLQDDGAMNIAYHAPVNAMTAPLRSILVRLNQTKHTPSQCTWKVHRAEAPGNLAVNALRSNQPNVFLLSFLREPTQSVIDDFFHGKVSVEKIVATDAAFLQFARSLKHYDLLYLTLNKTLPPPLDPLRVEQQASNNDKQAPRGPRGQQRQQQQRAARKKKMAERKKKASGGDGGGALSARDRWLKLKAREQKPQPKRSETMTGGNGGGRRRLEGSEETSSGGNRSSSSNNTTITTILLPTLDPLTVAQGIMSDYNFIGVAERMEESLVVLQMMLGLTTKDILYFVHDEQDEGVTSASLSQHHYGSRFFPHKQRCFFDIAPFFTPAMKRYFFAPAAAAAAAAATNDSSSASSEWQDDVIHSSNILYQAVNASLDRTIAQFPAETFQRNLRALQAGLARVRQECRLEHELRPGCNVNGFRNLKNHTCHQDSNDACDVPCIRNLAF